jgi:hypothetical protein
MKSRTSKSRGKSPNFFIVNSVRAECSPKSALVILFRTCFSASSRLINLRGDAGAKETPAAVTCYVTNVRWHAVPNHLMRCYLRPTIK